MTQQVRLGVAEMPWTLDTCPDEVFIRNKIVFLTLPCSAQYVTFWVKCAAVADVVWQSWDDKVVFYMQRFMQSRGATFAQWEFRGVISVISLI